ncbi:ParB/RepB/Spo0J family partition protein [Kitasatospora sp. NPDC051853]|uniref:ParB/RepB/Spo0J family partition protein n=1 Tax=Kitasatospora sp. NPDC051853 TaxID=3364058 RepID=UPI00378FFE5F
MGKRVSFLDMVDDEVVEEPGIDQAATPVDPGPAAWVPLERCLPNPRNPRDDLGDLSDLASIAERQISSCSAVTAEAYLRLWPEDRDQLGADPDSIVIVAGNRRLAAAHLYGRSDLMVVVDDAIAVSRPVLLRVAHDENEGRKDFDPIEEAKSVMLIVAEYPTAKDAAEAQGWTTSWISQRKSLLRLAPEVQDLVRLHARTGGKEGISIRDARRLAAVTAIADLSAEGQLEQLAVLAAADTARKAEAKRPRQQPAPGTGTAEFTAVNSGAGGAVGSAAPSGAPAAAAGTAAEFTAVNSLGSSVNSSDTSGSSTAGTATAPTVGSVPEQREELTPSHAASAEADESVPAVNWHDVNAFADAIVAILSTEEAYQLAEALENRILASSQAD